MVVMGKRRILRAFALVCVIAGALLPAGTHAGLAQTLFNAGSEERAELPLPGLEFWNEIMTPEECLALIEASEKDGFADGFDSIDSEVKDPRDNDKSQDVYVMDRGVVLGPATWAVMEPIVPRLLAHVSERLGPTVPIRPDDRSRQEIADGIYHEDLKVDWIFIRKYSSEETSTRDKLLPHCDSSRYTMNVALNDAYSGGGLFVIRGMARGEFFDREAEVPLGVETYEWLTHVERKNSSLLMFPDMPVGKAVLYNATVWHGVARYLNKSFSGSPPYTPYPTFSLTHFFTHSLTD
jgi:hypothetical protein